MGPLPCRLPVPGRLPYSPRPVFPSSQVIMVDTLFKSYLSAELRSGHTPLKVPAYRCFRHVSYSGVGANKGRTME